MIFSKVTGEQKMQWNDFISKNKSEDFLQSFDWGEFQKSVSKNIFRYALYDDDNNILAVASVVEQKMLLGLKYWYVPRGPIFSSNYGNRFEILKFFLEKLYIEAKSNGAFFIRIESPYAVEENLDFREFGLLKINKSIQPKDTLFLDLKLSQTELLSQMKQKTRYNIRLADKKGVEIFSEDANDKNFNYFWKLIKETSERDSIISHDKEYYRGLLNILKGDSTIQAKLYFAKYNDEIIASNIVLFFNDYAVYLHGASSNSFRNVMSPYAMQWKQICDAQERGCYLYDFWGITIEGENPKWKGITRFKEGFGGKVVSYSGLYDRPIKNILYKIYSFLKR